MMPLSLTIHYLAVPYTCMAVTAVVSLLQGALLLLSLAQSAPNLPQSFRDNATAVAQQAISQATLALSSSQGSATTPTKTQSQQVTLPNGSIVEMDATGNIIRTIVAAPTQAQATGGVQISSVNVTPTITTARIEWQTDKPTKSKLFLSGGGLSSKVYNSESGLSTRHSVSVTGLKGATSYSYEIEAIANGNAYKNTGNFLTDTPPPVPQFISTPTITLVEKGILAEKHNIFSAYVATDIPTTMVFTGTNARCETALGTSHNCQISVPVNYHSFSIVITSEQGVTNRFNGGFNQIAQ